MMGEKGQPETRSFEEELSGVGVAIAYSLGGCFPVLWFGLI